MGIRTDWKRAVRLGLSLAVLSLAACGGPGGGAVSHLSKRAFVSDDEDGTLHIENAANDLESGFTIPTGAQPGTMVLSPDKTITLVFDAGDSQGQLAVVSNSSESLLGRITLPILPPNVITGYVSMSNDTVGFVAVPNCPPASCGGFSNIVDVVDLATTFSVIGTVPIAQVARTLVLAPTAENSLLVFGGPGDQQDTFTVINTATAATTPATSATQLSAANCPPAAPDCFDRPVSAVFSSDDSKAYVFNCGPECGGTIASVTVLDMTATPPPPTTNIQLPGGASTGLLNGNTLYVAGTPSGMVGVLAGRLSVLDTTVLAPPASPVPISDGFHNHMELASNNKLFIGATPTCTAGCLTIFDTNANTAAVDNTTGNVTGIAPISERNVVYVVEDVAAGSYHCASQSPCLGKLRIYDTTASTPTLTPTQIDVVGKAVDVKYVDQ